MRFVLGAVLFFVSALAMAFSLPVWIALHGATADMLPSFIPRSTLAFPYVVGSLFQVVVSMLGLCGAVVITFPSARL